MASTGHVSSTLQPQTIIFSHPLRDGMVALGGLALIGGLYLDGWAHVHVPALESFFTPWHAVLYSGFLLLAASLVAPVLRGRLRGVAWRNAIPAGYGLGLLGIALFALGGLLDLGWHTLFGIEADAEALLSPPHLLLATGAGLMLSTPIRTAWARDDVPQRWRTWLPPLLSLALVLALLGFFTSYAHPFSRAAAAAGERPVTHNETHGSVDLAMSAILLQTGVLSGALLLFVRRWGWQWPLGSLTLLLALTLSLLTVMFDRFLGVPSLPLIIAAVLAGMSADALLRLLRPSTGRFWAVRSFAALAPATLYAFYLAAIALSGGVWWTPHLIFGAVVLAAITGWLVSYLVFPPDSRGEPAWERSLQ
jgi:hypothetical protein